MRGHFLIGAMLVGLTACGDVANIAEAAPAARLEGGVDAATAQKIERQLRLPDGARPVDRYARFYYVDHDTPAGMVSGWFVGVDNPPMPAWPRAGVHLEKPTVGVDDGGCFVISLTYDPKADRISEIRCNGHA
jgi:hypothetical protein